MPATAKPPLSFDMLYWVTNPGITAFKFRFRKIHAFTYTSSRVLETPLHPLVPVVLKRYAMREEIPLWWSCVTKREFGHKDRVVRSWLARRTRDAFKESMRKSGYDTDGRPLPGSGNKADLFGTAYFSVQRQATTTSFVDLVKQTDIAVSYIQRFQSRADNGKQWNNPKKYQQQTKVNGQKQWQRQRFLNSKVRIENQ